MPRVAGVNIVGVLVASLVFYFVGFVFFGLLFDRDWLLEILTAQDYAGKSAHLNELSTELLQEQFKQAFPGADGGLGMAIGYVNALVTVIVLAVVLRQLTAEAPGLLSSLAWTAAIVLGFAITTLAYDHIYAMASMSLFWMNFWHLVCAYAAAAIVLTFMD